MDLTVSQSLQHNPCALKFFTGQGSEKWFQNIQEAKIMRAELVQYMLEESREIARGGPARKIDATANHHNVSWAKI